jgi:hypothetical protein
MDEKSPTVEGVDAQFVVHRTEEKGKAERCRFVFGIWLKEELRLGRFVPVPKVKLVQGVLHEVNSGLDELKAGLSGVKLVLEI